MPPSTRPPIPRWWQIGVQRLAATRPMSWFFRHTLHFLDAPFLRLSNNRLSLTSLLTALPVVVLTTRGAKSGRRRSVPLVGMADGAQVILIASCFGGRHHPAWYHNLRAHPEAAIAVEGRTANYVAREAVGAERDEYWRKAVGVYAGYAAYARRARGRRIPVIVLTPKSGGRNA